jgi:hypothetical protein
MSSSDEKSVSTDPMDIYHQVDYEINGYFNYPWKTIKDLPEIQKALYFPGVKSVYVTEHKVNEPSIGLPDKLVPLDKVDELLPMAEPAPFGKGSETVLDDSVRKAMQIDLKNCYVNIGEPDVSALSPPNTYWSLKPYKVHIYGLGGHFKSHKDTLHGENHVATAVAIMDVEHEGGELVITEDEGKVHTVTKPQKGHVKWAIFYTDCMHEVNPVLSGNRVIVQYDIYEEKMDDSFHPEEDMGGAEQEPEKTFDTSDLTQALADYFEEKDGEVLGLPMAHKYPISGVKHLKGRDRIIFNALKDLYTVRCVPVMYAIDSNYDGVYKSENVCAREVEWTESKTKKRKKEEKTVSLLLPKDTDFMEQLKSESYIEYTGNEAQVGSYTYYSCSMLVGKK